MHIKDSLVHKVGSYQPRGVTFIIGLILCWIYVSIRTEDLRYKIIIDYKMTMKLKYANEKHLF